MSTFEEQYNNILLNMEIALVQTYREDENMTDWETLTAVNGLIRTYTAIQKKRNPPLLKLTPLAQQSYDSLKRICDSWLGHAPDSAEFKKILADFDKILSPAEIIKCLKRVRKSVEMWQKEGGRRGYFNFIDQFLPQ